MTSASGIVISHIEDVAIADFRQSSILDMATVESISKELYALVDQQAHRKVLLDFSQVQFLSSQMIGVLLSLQKKATAIKGRVMLCGLRTDVRKIFKIMKLEKMLEFAADEQEGMKLLGVIGRS